MIAVTPAAVPRWIAIGDCTSQLLLPLAEVLLSTPLGKIRLLLTALHCSLVWLAGLSKIVLESEIQEHTNVQADACNTDVVRIPA